MADGSGCAYGILNIITIGFGPEIEQAEVVGLVPAAWLNAYCERAGAVVAGLHHNTVDTGLSEVVPAEAVCIHCGAAVAGKQCYAVSGIAAEHGCQAVASWKQSGELLRYAHAQCVALSVGVSIYIHIVEQVAAVGPHGEVVE